MENLNAEQVIRELDFQTRFAKFANSNGVLISAKCVQFVLDHVQYYEQRIKELTEENEKLKARKYYIHSDGRIEMIPTVESVRANTVREMKERLRFEIINKPSVFRASQGTVDFLTGSAHRQSEILEIVDRIAKETLECK